jgi:Tol biopolymer transport system component
MGIDRLVWDPEGRTVAFSGKTDRGLKLFRKSADGTGPEELIGAESMNYRPDSWSADANNIAFHTFDPATGYDVWTVSIPDGKHVRIAGTPSNEATPMFSPDGRWIAYNSDESGRDEVYVQPFPGPGGKFQVTTEGGIQPVWTKGGSELVFRRGNQYWAVAISTTPAFSTGKAELLFEYPFLASIPGRGYDVSADGSKFVFRLADDAQPDFAPTSFNVVLGFAEEVRRRMEGTN